MTLTLVPILLVSYDIQLVNILRLNTFLKFLFNFFKANLNNKYISTISQVEPKISNELSCFCKHYIIYYDFIRQLLSEQQ